MRLSVLLALTALAGAAFAGCSPRPPAATDALPGTTWLVDRIVEPDGSVRRGTGETVAFGADRRVSLRSCNVCNGPYSLSGGVLTLSPDLACTRRACAPGTTELDAELVGPLAVRRDGEYLVLDGGADGRKVLLLPDNPVQPDPPAE